MPTHRAPHWQEYQKVKGGKCSLAGMVVKPTWIFLLGPVGSTCTYVHAKEFDHQLIGGESGIMSLYGKNMINQTLFRYIVIYHDISTTNIHEQPEKPSNSPSDFWSQVLQMPWRKMPKQLRPCAWRSLFG